METRTQQQRQNRNDKKSTEQKSELIIYRVFDLPVNTVWNALTDPEEFKKWFGPEGFTCPSSKMEAKVGGKYLHCMKAQDGKEYWSTGTVIELIPEKKLVITDSFSDAQGNIRSATEYDMPGNWPKELLITFEIEEADGATKLKLRHEGVPGEMHDECRKGWNESFDKLEENIK